jgi:hypothetical protein
MKQIRKAEKEKGEDSKIASLNIMMSIVLS